LNRRFAAQRIVRRGRRVLEEVFEHAVLEFPIV